MSEPVIIKSADFVLAAVNHKQYPADNLPQIAFAGRSNVGKSSLINALLGRKNLAKTSSAPGKTRQIVFFKINKEFYFVDLPGYGYAKVSKTELTEWKQRMEEYFFKTQNLRLLLLLLDIRHEPTELDMKMLEYLNDIKANFAIVLTKTDKLSKNEAAKQIRMFYENKILPESVPVIPFSSKTKEGKNEVWDIIFDAANKKDIKN